MHEGVARDRFAGQNNRTDRGRARNAPAPDRFALWAVFLALFAMAITAATANASAGGVSTSGGAPTPDSAPFGSRVLSQGMSGGDVKVLHGIMKSQSYAARIRLSDVFDAPTTAAVKTFQGGVGLPTSGVVDRSTSKAMIRSMPKAEASYYDLAGNSTACGQTLTHATIGVAHKTLPCGTKITFAYHGRTIIAPVIDRGPYTKGRTFDLTAAAADQLGLTAAGVDDVHYSVAR